MRHIAKKKFVPKIYSCPHESVFLITILIQKIMSMSLFNPPPQPENKTTRYGNRTGLGSLPSKQNDHWLYLYFPLYTLAIDVMFINFLSMPCIWISFSFFFLLILNIGYFIRKKGRGKEDFYWSFTYKGFPFQW